MSVNPSSKIPLDHLQSLTNHPQPFLDASSHLYKRVCPSVGPSVRVSIPQGQYSTLVVCLSWSSPHPSHLHNLIFFISNSMNTFPTNTRVLLPNSISFPVTTNRKHQAHMIIALNRNFWEHLLYGKTFLFDHVNENRCSEPQYAKFISGQYCPLLRTLNHISPHNITYA